MEAEAVAVVKVGQNWVLLFLFRLLEGAAALHHYYFPPCYS